MESKFDPESGRQKNLSFLRSEGPKMGPGCPKAPKRVSKGSQKSPKGSQKRSKIGKQFVEKRGPGPGAHPKGAKGTPGHPKSQKSEEF